MSLATAIRDTFNGFKSLVIGLRITAQEAAKPIITVQYPHDTLPMPARFRGHVQLVFDNTTGRARCTACGLCARACPSSCIVLDGVKREGEKRKSVSEYELNFTKCSLCGSCVEACASDAIEFSKQYNVVSLNRDDFAHMDLYAKIAALEKEWAEKHPQPVVAATVAPAPTAMAVGAQTSCAQTTSAPQRAQQDCAPAAAANPQAAVTTPATETKTP